MNCSISYVQSLPVCNWQSACVSDGYCFQGVAGEWGNLNWCYAGGYHSELNPESYSCASWDSGNGSVILDIPGVDELEAIAVSQSFTDGLQAGALYAVPVASALFGILVVVYLFVCAIRSKGA